jgi:alkanesulfonate monooxygenase
VWLHIITGGMDFEQRRDGDFLEHDERYARTDEYLEVMRRVWTTDESFDFDGRFYQAERVSSEVACWQEPHVPLWFGGISDAAIPVGARHCSMYALFGEPRFEIAALMKRIAGVAAEYQRSLEFNVSFRPIVADTEEAAWNKARKILARVEQASAQFSSRVPEAETARRLVNLIDGGEIQDERLWVPIAAASGGSGNSTALVGTPNQVAEAIVRYYDLGVRGVLIRGFDPFNDAVAYGRELIPTIRALVAERDAGQRVHA